jgi:hypothetical protein
MHLLEDSVIIHSNVKLGFWDHLISGRLEYRLQ